MKKRDPDLLLYHAPLLRQGMTTPIAMRDVVFALMPATAASMWFFGISAVLVLASCIAGAVLAEWLFARRDERGQSLRDGDLLLFRYCSLAAVRTWLAHPGSPASSPPAPKPSRNDRLSNAI